MDFRRRYYHMRKNEAGGEKEENFDDLLVFGYPCTIFRDDERAEWIENGSHLMVAPSDDKLTIDRYDCRLLLTSVHQFEYSESSAASSSNELSSEERAEQDLCDEERYKDLKEAEAAAADIVSNNEQLDSVGAAVPYDYGTGADNGNSESSSSEEEELYIPAVELKVPPDVTVPTTLTQNFIIEKTATFVSNQGPQMEIIINAKQKASKLFRFLDYDNPLNKYYKHVLKMIREKKYTPNLDNANVRSKKSRNSKVVEIVESNESDDDDDGNYLHPSLMAASSKKASSSSSPASWPTEQGSSYKLGESNDVYSELYNRLSVFMPKQEPEIVTPSQVPDDETFLNNFNYTIPDSSASRQQHLDTTTWSSTASPGNVVPPPPDLQPVIDRLAEYVARNGSDFEMVVRARRDDRFHFVEPTSVYYPYYCSKIHWYQYEHYMSTFYHGGGAVESGATHHHHHHHHHMPVSKSSSELTELEKVDKMANRKIAKPLIDHPWCTPTTSSETVSSTVQKPTETNEPKPFEKSKGVTISFSLKSKEKQDAGLSLKSKIRENDETSDAELPKETESPKPTDLKEETEQEPKNNDVAATAENTSAAETISRNSPMEAGKPPIASEIKQETPNSPVPDSIGSMDAESTYPVDLLDFQTKKDHNQPCTSTSMLQNARRMKARLFLSALNRSNNNEKPQDVGEKSPVVEKSSEKESKTSSSDRRHKRHKKHNTRSRSSKRRRRSRSRS